MNDAYPRECPVCGVEKELPSSFDLHMERNHTEEEARQAVMGAIVDELAHEAADEGGESP